MNWKCTICGYLHSGDFAPESCPLCSAPQQKFVEEEKGGQEKTASAVAAEQTSTSEVKAEKQKSTEKNMQWRCTVCGYIHEGDGPPEECPLCHVPKEKFVLVGSEEDLRIQAEKEMKKAAAKKRAEEKKAAAEDKPAAPAEWRCTVCGYLHKGEDVPKSCPVCGVGAEKFVPVTKEVKQTAAPAKSSSKDDQVRHWKCKVCQYIHEGDTPPGKCPICGAGAGAFIETDAAGNSLNGEEEEQMVEERKGGFLNFINRLIVNFHIHPIMAHFPNGILPVAAVFLAIGVFWGTSFLEDAAYYNLVAILLTLPIVIYAGFVEWKRTYMGAKTFVFITKILCGFVVLAAVATLVFWPLVQPGVNSLEAGLQVVIYGMPIPYLWLYLGIAAIGLGAAGIAGHLGGNLVFGKKH